MSVSEALRHARHRTHGGKRRDRLGRLRDSSTDDETTRERLAGADGILIPGGFGGRGIEGKIRARAGRPRAADPVPRHLPGHADRRRRVRPPRRRACRAPTRPSSTPRREWPVIDLLPEQKEVTDLGGTMRLGADPVKLHDGHARARDLRRGRHLRASPPPLRGVDHLRKRLEARRASSSPAPRPTSGSSRSSSCRASTRSSWPRSTTPSSSRGPSGRRRCSATSSPRRSTVPGGRSRRARGRRRAREPQRGLTGGPCDRHQRSSGGG